MSSKDTARVINLHKKHINDSRREIRDREILIAKVQAKCAHEHQVIVHSSYRGSYSYDYDDAHTECRKCVVCGFTEYQWKREKFEILKNPIRRFEIVEDKKSFVENLMAMPLSKRLKYIKEYGYTFV